MKKFLRLNIILFNIVLIFLYIFTFSSTFAKKHNKTLNCLNFASINSDIVYEVCTSRTLLDRVQKAEKGDKLVLINDIALSSPLYINTPITIDFNSHKIVFTSCETGINIETETTDGEIGFVSLLNGRVFMQNDGDYAIDIRKGNIYMNRMAIFGMNGRDGLLFGGNGGSALYIEDTENTVVLDSVVLVGGNSGIGRFKYGRTGDSILGSTRKLISIGDGFHFRYNDIIGYVSADTVIKNK